MSSANARAKPQRRSPRQARSRVAVAAILEAAAQVLARHGLERASTNHIAEAAGVSIGTLYQYFSCKEEVFAALAAHMLDRVVAAIAVALGREDVGPEARVEAAIQQAFATLARYPGVLRQIDAAEGSSVRRAFSAAKDRGRALVQQWIEANRGALQCDDPALSARVLVDAGEGILLNLAPTDDVARCAREVWTMVARYLAIDLARGRSGGQSDDGAEKSKRSAIGDGVQKFTNHDAAEARVAAECVND